MKPVTVAITRPIHQCKNFVDLLAPYPIDVLICPTIEIVPPENDTHLNLAVANLNNYDWLIFTSVNAIYAILERVPQLLSRANVGTTPKIAVVGAATEKYARERGLEVAIRPNKFTAEHLLQTFVSEGIALSGKKILLPQADIARPYLRETLSKMGAMVKPVVAYNTRCTSNFPDPVLQQFKAGRVDYLVFTSSSTVKCFHALLKKSENISLQGVTLISIGPKTTDTVRELNLPIPLQPSDYSMEGIVEVIKAELTLK